MSFDTDPGEQAQISASDFAQMCDEMNRLREVNAESVKMLEEYALGYSDADLEILANTDSGRGEIGPEAAKREIKRRATIAKATGKEAQP